MQIAPVAELASTRPKVRWLFLDGLRGLAAVYVVFHHAFLERPLPGGSSALRWIAPVFEFGRTAVDIFIVLSGFCLMLPVLRSPGGRLRSISTFFRRRVWRILPPYYVAVGCSLLCIWLVPGMGKRSGAHWDITLPAWSGGVLLSHLFLVHNLSPNWVYKINHALWSVATESQIYILFPLILLPVWRTAGAVALLAVSLGGGVGLFYLFPSLHSARPWYIGLFAMGMAAAAISVQDGESTKPVGERIPWGVLALLFTLAAASTTFFRASLKRHEWLPDVAVGLISFSLILFCAVDSRKVGKKSITLRLLQSKIAVWLGVTSYSLYLIHPPVIAMVSIFLQQQSVSPIDRLMILMTAGVGASLLAGWLFHVCVEQWFIPTSDPRRIASSDSPTIAGAGAAGPT